MKFNISISIKNIHKETINCELKNDLLYKLLQRISDRKYIFIDKNLKGLSEKYRKEIEVLLKHIKVI